MTPTVSQDQPGPSYFPLAYHQKHNKNQLFNSPNYLDSTSISASFFNTLDHTHSIEIGEQIHDQEPVKVVCSHKYKMEDEEIGRSSYSSAKWMCSEMRLMRKMMSTSADKASNTSQTRQRMPRSSNSNSINITRVCADCNTTSTPLWRSGPNGPKTLCNACGIRQRKARKAMAEGGNGGLGGSSGKTRILVNSKKYCQLRNKWKGGNNMEGERKLKLGFKDLAFTLRSRRSAFHHNQLFPRDEVLQGALLLMDLSCGFIPF